MTRKYELNGRTVMETKLSVARPNASFAADRLVIPEAFRTGASPRATGFVPYQWVGIRAYAAQGATIVPNNGHADGLLIGYVADARIGFCTDIWSPGAGPLPEKLTPGMAAIVATVKKAGIKPLKFAGGHGSTGDYEPMAALEGK